ncbi:phosphopantetheine-binding protein, partial [Sphingobacterium multivorum]
AYVVGDMVSGSDLRNYLSGRLPGYMVPGYYVFLEHLPLNSNGKVDRSLLPVPDGRSAASGVVYEAPGSETEVRLASIWSDVLGVEQVGVLDNFFELGGHSLKAVKVIQHIKREMKITLNLADFFHEPTIKKIGNYIDFITKQKKQSEIKEVSKSIKI